MSTISEKVGEDGGSDDEPKTYEIVGSDDDDATQASGKGSAKRRGKTYEVLPDDLD